MNFYNFLKQQYDNYKVDLDRIFTTSCDGCPCKALRYKVINPHDQTDCTGDMMYLANKYNIHDFNVFSCNSCIVTSLIIAKKLFEKEFNKI